MSEGIYPRRSVGMLSSDEICYGAFVQCTQGLTRATTFRIRNMSARNIVISQIEQVAREQKKLLLPLADDLMLLESGLDSLCLAIIVARLDDILGLDPFSAAQDAVLPVTVGEFIKSYEDDAD
jgi:hypothetical protein